MENPKKEQTKEKKTYEEIWNILQQKEVKDKFMHLLKKNESVNDISFLKEIVSEHGVPIESLKEAFEKIKQYENENIEELNQISMVGKATIQHQNVSSNLVLLIGTQLKKHNDENGTNCRVYHAPTKINWTSHPLNNTKINQNYEPDIFVVCNDKSNFTKTEYTGVPIYIAEILSKSSKDIIENDRVKKLMVYEHFGVKEYWIIDPEDSTVDVYELNMKTGKYDKPKTYTHGDIQSKHLCGSPTFLIKDIFN